MHRLYLQIAALDSGAVRAGLTFCLLLAACGGGSPEKQEHKLDVPMPSGPPVAQQVDAGPPPTEGAKPSTHWETVASPEGATLRLTGPNGAMIMSLACLGKPARMVATVPSFSPIRSEDRFSLGFGDEPVTLVADPARQKGAGATAEGAAPDAGLIEKAETVSALYGTQRVGPVPAPPEKLRQMLARACA